MPNRPLKGFRTTFSDSIYIFYTYSKLHEPPHVKKVMRKAPQFCFYWKLAITKLRVDRPFATNGLAVRILMSLVERISAVCNSYCMEQVFENLLAKSSDNFGMVTLSKSGIRQYETSIHNIILLVMKGSLVVSYGFREPVNVTSNYMIVIPANTLFEMSVKTETTFSVIFVRKDLAAAEMPLWNAMIGRARLDTNITALPVDDLLRSVVEQILTYRKAGISIPELYQCKSDEFMVLMRAVYNNSELVDFFNPLASDMIDFKDFVMYNYSRVRNIEEFAKLAGCSVSTFKRRFAEHFPIPAYQWMQIQRSKLILQDLANNILSIKQIAQKHGFASPSHLTRFCRHYFGNSPSAMRHEFDMADKEDREERERRKREAEFE